MEIKRKLIRVAVVTVVILLVPLIAQQFTDEVNWSTLDFLMAGVLIFSAGSVLILLLSAASNSVQRLAILLSVGATAFMIWANLAVGLIGSGPNAGNLMYIAVIAIGIFGAVDSGFTLRGMERTMYAMVVALLILIIVALTAGMDEYPGSSAGEILGVNALFIGLYSFAGYLYRLARHDSGPSDRVNSKPNISSLRS